MKLTKYLSFAVLAGAMLLTNCNKDDESTSPIRPSDAVNINFSVGGKQLTRSNPLGATDADQAQFNAGDQIAVSVTAPAEQSVVTFELGSNGTWTETGADFLRWKASAQTFKAVYPESAKDGFVLPPDQSTNIAAADYMLVETECTRPTNGTDISLRLERQTARIIVNITSYGNQYASDKQNVSDVKINGIIPYKQETSDQYIALVLPSLIEDAFITLKDGEDHELSVLRSDINTTFEAGNSYTFNLKVGKDGIKIGNVVVTEWNSATIEGGKAYAEGEEPVVEVETISLNKNTMELTVGGEETLTATVSPDNATDKTITWTSSDGNVATVDQNGKVTAVAAGTANIYATANDGSGVKAACVVTVTYKLTLSGQYWADILNETTHDLEDVKGDYSFTIEYTDDDTWGDIVAKYDWIYTTSYAYAPSGTIIHFTYSTDKGDIQAELKHSDCSSDTYNLVDINSKVADLAADGYFFGHWNQKY